MRSSSNLSANWGCVSATLARWYLEGGEFGQREVGIPVGRILRIVCGPIRIPGQQFLLQRFAPEAVLAVHATDDLQAAVQVEDL